MTAGGGHRIHRNVFQARAWRLFAEIKRFNREATEILRRADAEKIKLGEFLDEKKFGAEFRELYLLPMASAVWSCTLDAVKEFPAATHCFGDPKAELRAMAVIHDERFFLRALTGADVGMGESYMDGDWSSPDLVSVVRVATRNLRNLDSGNALFSGLRKAAFRWQHRHRDNSEKAAGKIFGRITILGTSSTGYFSTSRCCIPPRISRMTRKRWSKRKRTRWN